MTIVLPILVLITFVLIGLQQFALKQFDIELKRIQQQISFLTKHAFPQFCSMCGKQRFNDNPPCSSCGHVEAANEQP